MAHTPEKIAEIRKAFRELHAAGTFVIPNPWDVGSAKYLQGLGFKALASTSSGLAWSLGRSDNKLSREAVLSHLIDIVNATELPVNADFEDGFGETPANVRESVSRAVATGVAGLSIEDSVRGEDEPLRAMADAALRIKAARMAIDDAGGDVLLIGRAENFIVGRPDLADTIARLKAYSAAGADVLYAPGISDPADIRAVVAAVAPKPVNLLIGSASQLTVNEVAALGVRRVSVGGALARAAWGGFMRAAQSLSEGRFDGFAQNATGGQLNALFDADTR
jgi:2-methylisocitrate lyase-like PEP mutase family enzyme